MRISHAVMRPAAALVAVLGCLFATPSAGGPGDRIERFPLQLTSTIRRNDQDPVVAMEESGRFVTVWKASVRSSTSVTVSLMLRRFAADGAPLGDEVTVASHTNEFSFDTIGVALARDGSFVVVWKRDSAVDERVYARRYGANNGALGEAIVVAEGAPASLVGPGVASAADGRFVFTWRVHDAEGARGFAQLFDAAAVPQGAPFPVDGAIAGGTVAMSDAGNFVVTWITEDSAGIRTLLARRYDANGRPVGAPFTIASGSSAENLAGHLIAMNATGQLVVVYGGLTSIAGEPDPWSTGIYGRRYTADGTPLGGAFRVSAPGTVRFRGLLGVDANANGDFAIVWQQNDTPIVRDPIQIFLHTRLYRASGAPATLDQRYALDWLGFSWGGGSVGIDAATNFAFGFYALGRRPNGVGTQWVYVERFAGADDTRPACARYIATVVGGDGASTLHGGSGADVIYAGGGNDTLHAWGGDDVVCGGPGDDVIYAGSGNDHLVGGAGDDLLDGGNNYDYCNGEGHTNADTAVSCETTRNVP